MISDQLHFHIVRIYPV